MFSPMKTVNQEPYKLERSNKTSYIIARHLGCIVWYMHLAMMRKWDQFMFIQLVPSYWFCRKCIQSFCQKPPYLLYRALAKWKSRRRVLRILLWASPKYLLPRLLSFQRSTVAYSKVFTQHHGHTGWISTQPQTKLHKPAHDPSFVASVWSWSVQIEAFVRFEDFMCIGRFT